MESYNPAQGFTMSWETSPGTSYFLQYSVDLNTWYTLDYYHYGIGIPVRVVTGCPGHSRCFWRLKYTDAATLNPLNEDFDGDKISNAAELKLGTDPLSNTDADNDQLPDDWEIFYFDNTTAVEGSTQTESGSTVLESFQQGTNPYSGSQLNTQIPRLQLSIKSGALNVFNQAFREYVPSGQQRRYLKESIDYELNSFSTRYNGPWESQVTTSKGGLQLRREVNPISGAVAETGYSWTTFEQRTNYAGLGNPYTLTYESAQSWLQSTGSWLGNYFFRSRSESGEVYEVTGVRQSAPLLFDYTIPVISESPEERLYFYSDSGSTRSGSNRRSVEYTKQQFLSDAAASPFLYEDFFSDDVRFDTNLTRRQVSADGNSVSFKESRYKFKTPDSAVAALLDWYEMFVPYDDLNTAINEESLYTRFARRVWNKGVKQTESPEYFFDFRNETRNGEGSLFYARLVSNCAVNNGSYDMTKNASEFYPVPGSVEFTRVPQARENALILHFEDCATAKSAVAQAQAGFELHLGGSANEALWWEEEVSPPDSQALSSPQVSSNDPSVSVSFLDNRAGALKGGLYRFKLKRNLSAGTGVMDTPVVAQVWLPLAGPDIRSYMQSQINYYIQTWGPAYQQRLNERVQKFPKWMQNWQKNKLRLTDMMKLGGDLDWEEGPLGIYSPAGGPERAEGQEWRYTIWGVVTDFRKRNNMMYALIGRVMGLSEEDLLFYANLVNYASNGTADTPAAVESYRAGFDLFNGVSLRTVMLSRGRKMQEPNTWTRWEWPSDELSNGELRLKAAAQRQLNELIGLPWP